MPKKKVKKRKYKIKKSKTRKKKTKTRRIKYKSRKKLAKGNQELFFKTKSEWINKALINKSEYEKKYKKSLKNNDEC